MNFVDLLINWLFLTIAILIIGAVIPKAKVSSFVGAIIVAAVFGFINWLLGRFLWGAPALTGLRMGFVLPFLGYWVTNTILLKLTDWMTQRLRIPGFGPTVMAGLLMSVLLVAVPYVRAFLKI